MGVDLSEFHDRPTNIGPGTFKATAVLGTANIPGKKFSARCAMIYEYGINKGGHVRMLITPRVATPDEMYRAIHVLRTNSPDWDINSGAQ